MWLNIFYAVKYDLYTGKLLLRFVVGTYSLVALHVQVCSAYPNSKWFGPCKRIINVKNVYVRYRVQKKKKKSSQRKIS